jgi:hypothetical protein
MPGSVPQSEISRFSSIEPALVVRAYLFKLQSTIGLRKLQANLRVLFSPEALERAIKKLVAESHIVQEDEKLQLTELGHDAARRDLVKDASESWELIRARRLPILALGLNPDEPEARQKLTNSNSLKAAIVAVGFGLPKETALVPSAVRSELVWRVLRGTMPEVIGRGPFPLIDKSNAIDRFILAGLAGTRAKSINDAVSALAARAIGAVRGEADVLRTRLVQVACSQVAPTEPTRKESFAGRINAVASTLTTPPFQGRVAIAEVYDAYGRQHPDAGSLASFKERLVAAAKARELDLSRLDLPEHMDRDLRERSRTAWGSDTVHFVVTKWE